MPDGVSHLLFNCELHTIDAKKKNAMSASLDITFMANITRKI